MSRIKLEIIGDPSSALRALKSTGRQAEVFGSQVRRSSHDMGRFSRGAIAGSGALSGLGRSVAFASSAFLGGAGLIYAFRTVTKAAKESQVVQVRLAQAVRNGGQSWVEHRRQIRAVLEEQSRLSSFTDEELGSSLAQLVVRTKDVNRALELNEVAMNVARGRGTDLAAAQKLVLKASIGQAGALRRLGLDVSKTATKQQLLAALQKKFAGQATQFGRTAEGAQQRWNKVLDDSEEIIGRALLPRITELLRAGSEWLDQQNRSGNLQRTVNQNLSSAVQILGGIRDGLKLVKTATAPVVDAIGGVGNAVSALTVLWVGLKVKAIIGFSATALASSLTTKRVVADALTMEAALDIATRPRVIPITMVSSGLGGIGAYGTGKPGKPTRTPKPNVPKGGGFLGALKNIAGPAAGAAVATYLAAPALTIGTIIAVLASSGSASRMGDRSKKYPGVYRAVARMAKGQLTPAEFNILVGNMGSYSLENAPDKVMARTEAALKRNSKLTSNSAIYGQSQFTPQAPAGGENVGRDRGGRPRDPNRRTLPVVSRDLARARALGSDADVKALLGEERGMMKRQIRSLERRGKLNKSEQAALDKLYADLTSVNSELESMAKGDASDAKKSSNAAAAAHKKAAKAAKDAADKISDAWKSARTQAGQAFSDLFTGPLLGGGIGDFLRQYGMQGATIDPGVILKDIQMQNAQTAKLIGNLQKIKGRGAPAGFMNELRGMGPEGAGFIASIANAPKEIFNAIVKAFQQRQADLKKATVFIQAQNVVVKTSDTKGGSKKLMATGGAVPGSGHGDTVPAMLTPGELVLNKLQQGGLARAMGMPGAGPHAIFGAVSRMATGGVAGGGGGFGAGPGASPRGGTSIGAALDWARGKGRGAVEAWGRSEHRSNVLMKQQLKGEMPGQSDRRWVFASPLRKFAGWLHEHQQKFYNYDPGDLWNDFTRDRRGRKDEQHGRARYGRTGHAGGGVIQGFASGGVVGRFNKWASGHKPEIGVLAKLGDWLGRPGKTRGGRYASEQATMFGEGIIPTRAGMSAMGLFARDIGLGYLAPPVFGMQDPKARGRARESAILMARGMIEALQNPIANAGFLASMLVPMPGPGKLMAPAKSLLRIQNTLSKGKYFPEEIGHQPGNLRLKREPLVTTGANNVVRGAFNRAKATEAAKGIYAAALKQRDKKGHTPLPPGVNSADDIVDLMEDLHRSARAGSVGRHWYEESGASILKMAGGDMKQAHMFAKLAALYSPQVSVEESIRLAGRAWQEFQDTQHISRGRMVNGKRKGQLGFQWQGPQAERIMRGEPVALGRKSQNFYTDIMRGLDPAWAKAQVGKQGFSRGGLRRMGPHGATMDVWMQKAFGYRAKGGSRKGQSWKIKAPTDSQYDFMESVNAAVAGQLGWSPHETQAAIWTTTKGRFEGRPLENAALNIGDYMKRSSTLINFEAASGPMGRAIRENLGEAAAKQYMRQTMPLVSGVMNRLGLLGTTGFQQGAWVGEHGIEMNPGGHFLTLAPRWPDAKKKGRPRFQMMPRFQDRIDEAAAMVGHILGQDGMGTLTPFPKHTAAGTLNENVMAGNNALWLARRLGKPELKGMMGKLGKDLFMTQYQGGWVLKSTDNSVTSEKLLARARAAGLRHSFEEINAPSGYVDKSQYGGLIRRADDRRAGTWAWVSEQRRRKLEIDQEWMDKLAKHKLHAAGGAFVPGLGSRDTVPAMLTPGELVLNRKQQGGVARALGLGRMSPQGLFSTIDRFQHGGVVLSGRQRSQGSFLPSPASAVTPAASFQQTNTITVPPHFLDTEWAVERGLQRATWRLRKGI